MDSGHFAAPFGEGIIELAVIVGLELIRPDQAIIKRTPHGVLRRIGADEVELLAAITPARRPSIFTSLISFTITATLRPWRLLRM